MLEAEVHQRQALRLGHVLSGHALRAMYVDLDAPS